MYDTTYKTHLEARRKLHTEKNQELAPFNADRNAAASFQKPDAVDTLDTCFLKLRQAVQKPNKEQEEFLQHFIFRVWKLKW